MDEYRENVQKVQKALNQDAAFIQPNPYLAQRVLNAANANCNAKGGFVTMKKRYACTALVVVLMLLSLTAVAAVLLSMQQIVDDYAIPMANEYEGESYTVENTNLLLQLASENNIVLSQEGLERINHELEQGKGYYKDELIRELAKAEFGEEPLLWSLEEQKWYEDVCEALGLVDDVGNILPEKAEAMTEETITRAKQHICSQTGEPIENLSDSRYSIGLQYILGCEEINFSGKCWTVCFSAKTLEYAAYTVYMDEKGDFLQLTVRPGLSPESTAADIYHLYEEVYGSDREWTQGILISFRETLLQSSDQNHQAYLCMLQTGYPEVPPIGSISEDAAVALASNYLRADSYILGNAFLIATDGNPVWKFWMNTGDEQWSFEIDCMTGEFITVRKLGRDDRKWWMDFILWEVVDKVQENWVDSSPSFG